MSAYKIANSCLQTIWKKIWLFALCNDIIEMWFSVQNVNMSFDSISRVLDRNLKYLKIFQIYFKIYQRVILCRLLKSLDPLTFSTIHSHLAKIIFVSPMRNSKFWLTYIIFTDSLLLLFLNSCNRFPILLHKVH